MLLKYQLSATSSFIEYIPGSLPSRKRAALIEPVAKTDFEQGSRNALWLKFQLPPSAYATMLFRELLKMPTDLDNQKQLTNEIMNKMEED